MFAGGFVGTVARAELAEALRHGSAGWPWATFTVNIVGAFLLGYFTTRLQERLPLSAYRRPLLGTGLCGGLTTFSAMQVELLRMLDTPDSFWPSATRWRASPSGSSPSRWPPISSVGCGDGLSVLVLVAVGGVGGIGAIARFVLDGAVSSRFGRAFPYGTMLVNVSGTFSLGLMVGAALGPDAYRIAGPGLIGAFTTFSTWTLESHRLAEDGELRLGVLNFAVSLTLGVAAAAAGRLLGASL